MSFFSTVYTCTCTYLHRDGNFRGVGDSRSSGYVDWSLSTFRVANLIDGSAFPGFASHRLQLYNREGERIEDANGNDLLYLPFIDFDCLLDARGDLNISGGFLKVSDPRYKSMLSCCQPQTIFITRRKTHNV